MAAKQPKVEPVKKPYLKGSFCGKDAWKTVPKRFAGMLMICFVYAIASMIMNFDSLAGRIIVGVLIVGIALYYVFAKGMEQGTGDVGYGEMMYARQQEGKTIAKLDSERCYHPLKGFFEALLGALPYVLVALVFAVLTKPTVYSLGGLPSWTQEMMLQDEFGDALRYYQETHGMTALEILRIIVRIMCMPVMSVATYLGTDAALLAERLSPLFLLLPAAAYGIGYLQGPAQRERINTGIKIGVSKKQRKQQREKKARKKASAKTPERLI